MDERIETLKRIYASFNARDIDGVLRELSDDVVWANAMEGGHVQGREAVRDYWTRQWSMVDPHVEPVAFMQEPDEKVVVTVIQTVRDLDGKPLEGQTHDLKDKTVHHVFRFEDRTIIRFDVGEAT